MYSLTLEHWHENWRIKKAIEMIKLMRIPDPSSWIVGVCKTIEDIEITGMVPLFPSVLFSFHFVFLKHKREDFPGKTFIFAVKGKLKVFKAHRFPPKL